MDMFEAYLEEAKWFNSGYVPSFKIMGWFLLDHAWPWCLYLPHWWWSLKWKHFHDESLSIRNNRNEDIEISFIGEVRLIGSNIGKTLKIHYELYWRDIILSPSYSTPSSYGKRAHTHTKSYSRSSSYRKTAHTRTHTKDTYLLVLQNINEYSPIHCKY